MGCLVISCGGSCLGKKARVRGLRAAEGKLQKGGRELLVDRKETPRDDQDRDETARSSCVFLEIG